jgi:hypothetical protein
MPQPAALSAHDRNQILQLLRTGASPSQVEAAWKVAVTRSHAVSGGAAVTAAADVLSAAAVELGIQANTAAKSIQAAIKSRAGISGAPETVPCKRELEAVMAFVRSQPPFPGSNATLEELKTYEQQLKTWHDELETARAAFERCQRESQATGSWAQTESRKFTSFSNVVKTHMDAAKAIIRNLR